MINVSQLASRSALMVELVKDRTLLVAALGGAAWVLLPVFSAVGMLSVKTIKLLVLLAPLVIVPLGLHLSRRIASHAFNTMLDRLIRTLLPVGSLSAVASFAFEPGTLGALMAGGWLLVTCLMAVSALLRLRHGGFFPVEDSLFGAAFLYLPVGAAWLVLSRMGAAPLGFKEPIVLLTAAHFHYSGFAAPIIVGATGKALSASTSARRKSFRVFALGVIAAPALVAVGFVISTPLKTFSAFLLTACLIGCMILALDVVLSIRSKIAVFFLIVSSVSIVAGMALACTYAVGDLIGHEFISIARMAEFHGVVNSLGFSLCGLLGWTLAMQRPEV